MKRIITSLLCAVVSIGAMAHEIPYEVVGNPPAGAKGSFSRMPGIERKAANTRASGEDVLKVNFVLDDSKGQYVGYCIAVPTDAAEEGYINSVRVDYTHYAFEVPEGTYDIMAIVCEEEAAERVVLIKEDFEYSGENSSLDFDVASATYTTRISHTDSFGTKLTLPSLTEPYNCTCGEFYDYVTHNGILCWVGGTLAYMECNYIMSTNNPDSRFSIIRADIVGAETESASMLIPVDFHKDVCGPTSSEGWQVQENEFVTTPFMQAFETKYPNDMYTYLVRAYIINDNWWGTSGVGIFDMHCNGTRVAIWAPEEYDGILKVASTQISNDFYGDDGCVQGMFLMRGENSLTQIGINTPMGERRQLFITSSGKTSITHQFSRYSGTPQPGIRGNATPLLLASTAPNKFFYTYKGRFGEDLSLDSFDILDSFDNEQVLEQLGGNPSRIKIYADGNLICSSRHDLPWGVNWVDGAENKAEIEMDNVLIDNAIPGKNTATIVWNADKGNGFAPTFTSMQFRDKEDNITDRFEEAQDGVLEFTVGDMALKINEEESVYYFDIEEVKSVSAEYAPHGSEEFSPIDVQEIPELFFSPGYGYFFRGTLASVDRKAMDGWFDLRLRANDKDGAYIEQVISPAFKISSLAGVDNIKSDSEMGYEISGNNILVTTGTKIFTLDGKECTGRNLEHGLYIIAKGSRTVKILL